MCRDSQISKFNSPQNQNLVLLQIQKANSVTTASCFFTGKIVFVKCKLLYKFLVTTSDQTNLLTKHKFTNLKHQKPINLKNQKYSL